MSGAQVTEATVKELCDAAALAVEIAKKHGADHAEVLVRDGSELTAKVRLGEPELVQEAGSRALGLRVLKGAKRAVTYTSDLRRESLEALCAETVALAELAEADEYALPPDPALLAKQLPDLDLYDPAVADVDAAWALREAKTGEAAAQRHDKRVTNSEGATWSRVLGATAFATSGGFVGGYRGSYASLVVEPLCDDTTDPTRTADDLTDTDKAVMEMLKELFPDTCRFVNARVDVKTVAADTTLQKLASIPICLTGHSWKEF